MRSRTNRYLNLFNVESQSDSQLSKSSYFTLCHFGSSSFIFNILLAFVLYLSTTFSALAQDSLWIKYDDRFTENKCYMSLKNCDSLEFRYTGNIPILRQYSTIYTKGYFDFRLSTIMSTNPGCLMFHDPGLILYKPSEFSSMSFSVNTSQWCFERSRESDHFVVFWEKGFGSDPGSVSVPSAYRVDIDDLLEKAEQFYTTNVEKLQMVVVGEGKSRLDKYKIGIYLYYQSDWLATGSGYDDKVGALWINPSTAQPAGSTIAHEVGHTFQYQTYCDNVMQMKTSNYQSGFRYGYPNSNGGNGFWEQCAQWQSYQDYPSEAISTYHTDTWFKNCHRHFEAEWQRYASYWLQYYMTEKNGITAIGRIWNESKYPEDAIQAYMRIFCEDDYDEVRKQLIDYALKSATFDFSGIRTYVGTKYDNYSTEFIAVADEWWQVTYANCISPTGFNVIPLDIPQEGTTVSVDLIGLSVGSDLADGDEGTVIDGDGNSVSTVSTYNTTDLKGNEGWALGFVALQDNNTRVYGDAVLTTSEAHSDFIVPENTKRLFLVVQGSPLVYRQSPWDENELTDDQLPYRIKVTGTTLQNYVYIDPESTPSDIDITYNVSCNSSSGSFEQGTIDLLADGTMALIGQAFCMQPATIINNTSTIGSNIVGSPSEGKVVFGLEDAQGNISYSYSANYGFYCNADGSVGSYSAHSPVYVEYTKASAVLSYGHYPGYSTSGTIYTLKPVLVYTLNGVQYKARITLNLYFDIDIPEE